MKLPSGNTPYAGVAFPAALSCGLPGGKLPHENCLVKPVACMEKKRKEKFTLFQRS